MRMVDCCWMIMLVVTDWIRIMLIIIEGGASAPDDMMGA